MKLLKIYSRIARYRLKGAMQYRSDFLIGVSGLLIQQVVAVVVILFIFESITDIAGFTRYEILFILGFSQLVRGLDMLYNDYIWVEAFGGFSQGSMYLYMTKPQPIYFQIICQRLNTQSLGQILFGAILLVMSIRNGSFYWEIKDYFVLIYFVSTALIVLFSMKLLCASLALWFGRSGELMQVVHEFIEFTKYPINIYALPIQMVLYFILPFSLLSFIPSLYWIRDVELPLFLGLITIDRNFTLFIYTASLALIFYFFSLLFWKLSLKNMNITGT
ncbi:ABC transporter permease [Photorhabdus tasmaniensis]|uniref:ABC transporter permease n=1 Tax=Photorhabdus tasmaniensis TaxID=1004159 RepID=UPI0040410119